MLPDFVGDGLVGLASGRRKVKSRSMQSEPEAPDRLWYKDFGTFKICGEGKFPKTFLLQGQAAKGKPL